MILKAAQMWEEIQGNQITKSNVLAAAGRTSAKAQTVLRKGWGQRVFHLTATDRAQELRAQRRQLPLKITAASALRTLQGVVLVL